MCDLLRSASPTVPAMTERDPARLASTVHEFPQFRIWREITADREPRFVARRRHPGVSPHTVVTPDLAELRAALATSPGRGPAVGPGAFKPRIPHTVSGPECVAAKRA